MTVLGPLVIIIIIVVFALLSSVVKVAREYERGIIFRLGRLQRAKGPGVILLIPIVDRMTKIDLRVVTLDIPRQEMMTRDNVPVTVDAVLSQRDRINQQLQQVIDEATEPWGIKVTLVEVRDVVLPDTMKRAMAKQAETERERRAKVINAEGEYQAAERLVEAAAKIATQPVALQLRFLQALTEVATEHNSTTIFPIPIDIITPFLRKASDKGS